MILPERWTYWFSCRNCNKIFETITINLIKKVKSDIITEISETNWKEMNLIWEMLNIHI